MGFIGSFLGRAAGEAVSVAASAAKNKIADYQEKQREEEALAAKAQQEIEAYAATAKRIGTRFQIPRGYCEGAVGELWRVKETDGDMVLLRQVRCNPSEHWFNIYDILEFYVEE
ncbi:MAG: hypothetical protein LUG91_11360 [Ruminococcus sp.]|nr:hypothetical protein [Ruminococcus sp.]